MNLTYTFRFTVWTLLMLHCVHLSGIEFSPIEIGLYIIIIHISVFE